MIAMDERSEEQARKPPARARILDLYEEDRERSLAARDLIGDLRAHFGEVSLAHVEYHLQWLREAGFIPPFGDED